MAKTVGAEKKGLNFFQKVATFFKRTGLRIARSFKDMYAELKKVTWPTRPELINYTLVVVAFMVLMGIVVLAIDTGAAALMTLIVG
jgi:preprotein translocase subunit SecE